MPNTWLVIRRIKWKQILELKGQYYGIVIMTESIGKVKRKGMRKVEKGSNS